MATLWRLVVLGALAFFTVAAQDSSSQVPFSIVRSVDEVLDHVDAATRTSAVLIVSTAQQKQLEQPASEDDIAALVTAIAPHFASIVEGLRDAVDVIVADVADGTPVAKQWRIGGLPALITYADVPQRNPYTGAMYREAVVEDVSVLTQPSKLRKRLRDRIPSTHVTDLGGLSSDNQVEAVITKHIEHQDKVVMLISKQKTASHLYRAVSVAMVDRHLAFTYVPRNAEIADVVMAKIGKEEHDGALLLIWTSLEEFEVVDAKNIASYAALEAAVLPFASEPPAQESEKTQENTGSSSSSSRKMPKGRAVTMLTATTFASNVLESDLVWIVSFLSPEQYEQRDESDWKKRLHSLQERVGLIALGGVNCAEEAELCEKYGGAGVIRVFPIKANQAFTPKISRDTMLDEEFETFEEATQAAIDSLPNRVHVLHEYPELSAFIANAIKGNAMPVLLMAKNPTIPPMLKGLALSLRQNVAFGLVWNPDEGIKQKFNVRASASKAFVCLIAMDKDESNAPADHAPFGVVLYKKKAMGPYSYPNLLRFLVSVLSEYPSPPDSDSSSSEDLDSFADSNADVDTAVTVPYMTKENAAEHCSGTAICAIAFLEEHPGDLEDSSSTLQSRLMVLQNVAAQSKRDRQPYRFMWTNGKCQSAFAQTFEVGAFQMPTTVVYAPSKQRYATNMGLFDEENTAAFLRGVLSGNIPTVPVPSSVPELGDECSYGDIHDDLVAGTEAEEDDDLGDLLSEIQAAEEQQRRELEASVKAEQKKTTKKGKKGKKQTKSKKGKKSKNGKSKRDEL